LVVHAKPSAYIVGGQQADVGEYPYFVEMGGCGGALIAPDTVLFAAHCGTVVGSQVIIGSYHSRTLEEGAEARFCADWVQHPGWIANDGGRVNWDIALCKLDDPIEIGGQFLEWENTPELSEGDDLIVVGYGALTEGGLGPEYIHDLTIPYISNDRCGQSDMYGGLITPQMLCAGVPEGGRDACQGDSGGPIVLRSGNTDYHMGVVSFGDGCARESKPGVYARTSEAAPWIREAMCGRFNSVACENHTPTNDDDNWECPGAELDVRVGTDGYGYETSWRLTEQESGGIVQARRYIVPNYDNVHTVCVETLTCYNFVMTDAYGDGMCVTGDCGFFELRTPGEDPFKRGGTFERTDTTQFCIDEAGNQVRELPEVASDNRSNSKRAKTAKVAKKGKAGKAGKSKKNKARRVLRVRTATQE
jgi:hypothetical protein